MGYVSIIHLILIIAAIAIPNLMRARISANESCAASTVRMLNTSQVTYSQRTIRSRAMPQTWLRWARTRQFTAAVTAPLNMPVCWTANWASDELHIWRLVPQGRLQIHHQFNLQCATSIRVRQGQAGDGRCVRGICDCGDAGQFKRMGRRSFCAMSDAVWSRFKVRIPLATPPTAEECEGWGRSVNLTQAVRHNSSLSLNLPL